MAGKNGDTKKAERNLKMNQIANNEKYGFKLNLNLNISDLTINAHETYVTEGCDSRVTIYNIELVLSMKCCFFFISFAVLIIV